MYYKKRVKMLRKFGCKIPSFTTKKIKKRKNNPGQHGFYRSKGTVVRNLFSIKLRAKQKLKLIFCISERQLRNYMSLALYFDKVTPFVALYNLLTLRLDFLIFSNHFAKTILEARQMISHGHFYVDGVRQKNPGFICKVNTTITTDSVIALKNINHYNLNYVSTNLSKNNTTRTVGTNGNNKNISKDSICALVNVSNSASNDLSINGDTLLLLDLIKNAFEFYL